MPNQPVAPEAPASLADSEQSAVSSQRSAEETEQLAAIVAGLDYPLDWTKTNVALHGGCVAVVRRPTNDEILERESEMQVEVPMGKDGGFAIPDPTLNDEIDAKYFDLFKIEVTGFKGTMMEQHKAEALKGMLQREVYVDEDFELDHETVPVLEEIGNGVEPDFTVLHTMRPPTESELKLYRRKSANGEIKPGKRGRQKFVSRSNLKAAMSFYAQWLVEITGATIDGKGWTDEDRAVFIAHVNPLVQRQVVDAVVEAYTVKLSD